MLLNKTKLSEVPKQSRPRERLIHYGEKSLSDHELLAIILRTGTKTMNVLDLSIQVLNYFEDLASLRQASVEELQKINGIGPSKAIEIKAAIEFGTRLSLAHQPKLGTVVSTQSAGDWLLREMAGLHQEHLMALFLNAKNEILKKKIIFKGTVNSCISHPREIFKEAVKYPTARLIIAHNHPSGDVEPSTADIQFTKRLIVCGEIMGIEVLDHIIVGQFNYMSLREESDVFD